MKVYHVSHTAAADEIMRHGFRDIETSVGTTPLWLAGVFVSDEPLAVTKRDDVIEVVLQTARRLRTRSARLTRGTASGACPQPCSTVATEDVSTGPRWMLVRPAVREVPARTRPPLLASRQTPQSERRSLDTPTKCMSPSALTTGCDFRWRAMEAVTSPSG